MIDQDTLATGVNNVAETSSSESFDFSWDFMYEKGIEWGTSLITAILILVIGLMIAKRISKMTGKLLERKKIDSSLRGFLTSMVGISLKILVIISALTSLGMEMTSFVALIGAAGLAVGMAFSGTLGNLKQSKIL